MNWQTRLSRYSTNDHCSLPKPLLVSYTLQMWSKRRYHEIFFMIDTCQAASMYARFYSPNVLAVASSLVGEDSLSHHVDPAIGVYIIDRYTYYALEFLERVTQGRK